MGYKFPQTQPCLFELFHQVDDMFITKGRAVEMELGPGGIKRVALSTKEQAPWGLAGTGMDSVVAWVCSHATALYKPIGK